jgi:hypothetical protein
MKSPASRLKPQNGAVHFAYFNFCRIHTTLRHARHGIRDHGDRLGLGGSAGCAKETANAPLGHYRSLQAC